MMSETIVGNGILKDIDWSGIMGIPKGSSVLAVADTNTYAAAGVRVMEGLKVSGFDVRLVMLDGDGAPIEPDSDSAFRALEALTPEVAALVSVGSGCVTDIGRFCAHRCRIPHFAVGTAASMDGYTSSVSPLIYKGFKRTYPAMVPRVVIADTEILSRAPVHMTAAGFGDLLGKFTANADWVVANLAFGEVRPPEIWEILRNALDTCCSQAEGLARGDIGVVEALAKGLLDSGNAIAMVGNSRPASGAEHLLSHAWEMLSIKTGEYHNLHGAQVGVAAVIIAGLYRRILSISKDDIGRISQGASEPDHNSWIHGMCRIYGSMAGAESARETGNRDRSSEGRKERLNRLALSWDVIQRELLGLLPEPEFLEDCLLRAGAPRTYRDLGIPKEWVRDALLTAHNLRNRYTALNLAEDLGILEDFANNF